MIVIVIRFNFLYTLINRRFHIELCVFGTTYEIIVMSRVAQVR